jgi:hypothetical protein
VARQARASYRGNLQVDRRHGLIVDSLMWEAAGDAAPVMLQEIPRTRP